MGSRSTTNWVQESKRINCFIDRSATHFELFQIKISEFRIPLDSNGVIYDMNHTLSIKEIFQRFPCLYFEKKGIQMIGNLFQPKILPKFSISINGNGALTIFIDAYWGRPDPLFFYFFPSLLFKEGVVLLSVYALSTRNDIEIVVV